MKHNETRKFMDRVMRAKAEVLARGDRPSEITLATDDAEFMEKNQPLGTIVGNHGLTVMGLRVRSSESAATVEPGGFIVWGAEGEQVEGSIW